MKKCLLVVAAFLLMPLTFLLQSVTAAAAADANKVDFSVQAILPDNQRDQGNTFFDLLVKPGDTQTLKVQINNFSKKAQTFSIAVNTAQTNANLKIDYSQAASKVLQKQATSIEQYVDYPEEVTIPAEKAGVVSIKLNVPEKSFTGILLGGVHVKRAEAAKATSANEIVSDYDYVIGLMLAENDTAVTPDLKLIDVNTEVISNNAGLTVELANNQPINISKVHMLGTIYRAEDTSTPVISREITAGGIAPSSTFKLNFFNGEAGATKPLEAGDYELQLAFTDGNNQTWNFKKAFTITKKEAQVVNNKVFVVKKDNTLLFVIIGILLALLVAGLIIFFILWRRKKKTPPEEDVTTTK